MEIKIDEIEQHDTKPEPHVFYPVTLVLAVALGIQLLFGLGGCADTGDDPCDPETGEECEDVREEIEIARGGFEPYKPEKTPGPQGKLQALTPAGMPHGIWTSGFIETVDATWNITTGGFNRFRRKAQVSPTVATYHTEVAEAVLAKRFWKWKCIQRDTTLAWCLYSGRQMDVNCPAAKFIFPLAYDYGQTGNPTYGFGNEFKVTSTPTLKASRMEMGTYLETDGKRYPQITCRYPIGYREVTVAKKRPSTF